MTPQSTVVRSDALDQAIQIVIRNVRIPKSLRTALEAYQGQWSQPSEPEIGTLNSGQTEATYLPETIDSSDAEHYPCSSPTRAFEDSPRPLLSCESAVIEQGLFIIMKYNKRSLDWSVEINGQRHEGVTSEVMEALIECAAIVAEKSLIRASSHRPQ